MFRTIRQSRLVAGAFSIAAMLAASTLQAGMVFQETFDRTNSSTFGTNSGPTGSGTWTKTITAASLPPYNAQGSFSLTSGMAVATHNNDDAIYQISMPTSSFTGDLWPVSNKLSDAQGKISWYINMQSTLTTPNGIGVNAGGMGFALGSTNTNFGQTGNNGYILYIGNSSAVNVQDPIHLATYTSNTGLDPTLTDIVNVTTAPFNNVGGTTNFYSYRVDYTPTTNTWELFARDDGALGFADPSISTGYVNLGSGINSTYTNVGLSQMGLTGSWRSPSFVSQFDNIMVSVVPEPSAVAVAGLGLAMCLFFLRRVGKQKTAAK